MMKLYIPRLGDILILSKDWEFRLYKEYRNDSLFEFFKIDDPEFKPIPYKYDFDSGKYYTWRRSEEYHEWVRTEYAKWLEERNEWQNTIASPMVSLPKDTKLKINRIYIRKGMPDFDSVTFNIIEIDGKKVKKLRFWAKLDDVNKLEFKYNAKNNFS